MLRRPVMARSSSNWDVLTELMGSPTPAGRVPPSVLSARAGRWPARYALVEDVRAPVVGLLAARTFATTRRGEHAAQVLFVGPSVEQELPERALGRAVDHGVNRLAVPLPVHEDLLDRPCSALVDLRRRPRIGGDALEVAVHDVITDATQV